MLGGKKVRGLVDTGCTTALVRSQLVDCRGVDAFMTAFDGRKVKCKGRSRIELVVAGRQLSVYAVVIDDIVCDVDVVVGMEVIAQLGGVLVTGDRVQFGVNHCNMAVETKSERESVPVVRPSGDNMTTDVCVIEDRDFKAIYDGSQWEVEWYWKEKQSPVLANRISCYDKNMTGRKKEEFEKEVERWIEEGILVPWSEEVDIGIIPLMAVEQPTKNKVRPVLDFRELNAHVECHTGDEMIDVCSESLRQWRQVQGETTLVDLKSAYLQIRVSKKLWKYQLVKYKGRTYCLTRLGFGLNVAPRIMSRILKTVLSQSDKIRDATSSYIDDILLNESQVPAVELVDHLHTFGLTSKPPEPLEGGAVLGLKLYRSRTGDLIFRRGNELPVVPESLTRRELFSVCGKLVGHYPIAGWLRLACSYIKRRAEGTRWEDYVGDHTMTMITEVLERVRREDPVEGRWNVPVDGKSVVWCDASSIGLGVLLEMEGQVIEDAAWLRKKGDYNHINVAELEAILKGVNLALKWGLKNVNLMTDSATVHGWVNTALTEEKRIRTKGAAEMIVKRRLGILKNLIEEFDLKVTVSYVPTSKNKADVLTRVKRHWLPVEDEAESYDGGAVCATAVNVKEMHNMHHVGVDRTLYLARKIDPTVTRHAVQRVVSGCERCQSIDPAPVMHEGGELIVKENWMRLAIDVTHYRQAIYLSIVDCGPGRFAIWKELVRETAECVTAKLNEVFLERGPVAEILMDNSTVFRSEIMKNFLEKWNIHQYFRAAYRPSGNGVVERHHRTIKVIAERGNITPMEAVFWYNMTPRSGQSEASVPQRAVYRYEWRHPAVPVLPPRGAKYNKIEVGEEVWVKPPQARCTVQWQKGVVTDINSNNNVSVNGVPRHVLDVRRVVVCPEDADEGEDEQDEEHVHVDEAIGPQNEGDRRYPGRVRRPPQWMNDYVVGDDGDL